MHWLDTTLLVLLALAGGLGFWSGLLWQVARIIGLGLAGYATILFHQPTVQALGQHWLKDADPRVVQGSAYVLVFLGVYLLVLIVTQILRKVIQATELETFDRLFGAVLAAGQTAIVLSGFCLVLKNFAHPQVQDWMDKSMLAPQFAQGMETALRFLPEDYKSRLVHNFIPPSEPILSEAEEKSAPPLTAEKKKSTPDAPASPPSRKSAGSP